MSKAPQSNADSIILLAVACGATAEVAANKAGVSTATVHRRLKKPEFKAQLQKMRADMVERTIGMLTAAAGEAVKTLLSLQKETVQAAVRLGAAKAILEIGMRLREVSELEDRIAALEEQLKTQQPAPLPPAAPPTPPMATAA
jgi:hypothetical protein